MSDLEVDRRLFGIFEMSESPRTYRGLDLPEWFDLAYAGKLGDPTVVIRVLINPETGPVPIGVTIIENTATATYRDAVNALKGVRLEDILHDGMLMAAGAWGFQEGRKKLGKPSGVPLTQEEAWVAAETATAAQEQAKELPRPQLRRSTTPDLLREAAEVYRAAVAEGHPPTVAVAEHFKVSHRTGARWVAQARQEGFLRPAPGTRAGEVPADDKVTPSERSAS